MRVRVRAPHHVINALNNTPIKTLTSLIDITYEYHMHAMPARKFYDASFNISLSRDITRARHAIITISLELTRTIRLRRYH